jgi:hypothetical protein
MMYFVRDTRSAASGGERVGGPACPESSLCERAPRRKLPPDSPPDRWPLAGSFLWVAVKRPRG